MVVHSISLSGLPIHSSQRTSIHQFRAHQKHKMKTSPCQRSLKKLRSEGWFVAIVERWNPWAKIRQDLFGFIDLLAIKGNQTLAVQTTSGANASARVGKILASQGAQFWLESPSRTIIVHAWRKAGLRGKRKTWECREIPIHPTNARQVTTI